MIKIPVTSKTRCNFKCDQNYKIRKTLAAKIIFFGLILIVKFANKLTGTSLKTELLIMTFLDAITSLWDWSPFDWGNQVETIRKTSMSQKKSESFEQNIKTVLSWVVVSRVVIAHIYIFTYIFNFYSILLWSQRRMLLPWMVISAFKNFILEVIVFIVAILLYIEGDISDYLLGGLIIEKLISLGLAAQNWFLINSFFMKLKEIDQRKLINMSQRKASTFNLLIGMSMRHPLRLNEPDPHIKKRQRFISVPNFDSLPVDSPTEFGEETKSIRISRSLNTISMLSVRYFDHKDTIFNANGFSLTISERVIMILGVPHDYVEKVKLKGLISQAGTYSPITIQEENSSLSCTCPSDSKNSDESDSEKPAKVQSIENYSNWTKQWTMTNIFEKQEAVDVDKASLSDKSCQYSEASGLGSDFYEESLTSLGTKAFQATYLIRNNIKIQENGLQNVFVKPIISEVVEASEEDKTIFATWIRDLVYVGILKKEVGLFEDSEGSSIKSVFKETGTNSTVVQRQTQTEVPKWENVNQVNFVTVQNLTLPRDPVSGWAEYGSDLRVKKSFEKAKTENRELEALKLYNERTLWRYKRLMDLERLKPDMVFKDEKKSIKVANLNIKLSHRKDMQKGRELVRVKAVENIPASFASEKSSPEKKAVNLKTRIAQIDWAFPNLNKFSAQRFKYKQTVFDVIDDKDTATLLQSAFSFDHHEFRGFPLGPREFYSARNDYIPNVFEEIVKAARTCVIRHDCPNYSTLEIDYGDGYLKDLDRFGEKEVCRTEISQTEIIRSSDMDVESQLQDTQVILIEHWVKKFKEIVSSNGSRSLEELARLPGFSLLKKLIDKIDTLDSAASVESVNSLPEVGPLDTDDSGIKENVHENNVEFVEGSKPVNEAYLSIFDDECNWSDESATFLNFGQTSETSLENESNMSEFSACL